MKTSKITIINAESNDIFYDLWNNGHALKEFETFYENYYFICTTIRKEWFSEVFQIFNYKSENSYFFEL